MEKKRESFVIFKDWDNAIRKAPENIQLELYHALMDFVSTGIKPKNLSWEGEMLMSAIENSVGSMIAKYKSSVENGKLGGRPKYAKCKENLEKTSCARKTQNDDEENSTNENLVNSESVKTLAESEVLVNSENVKTLAESEVLANCECDENVMAKAECHKDKNKKAPKTEKCYKDKSEILAKAENFKNSHTEKGEREKGSSEKTTVEDCVSGEFTKSEENKTLAKNKNLLASESVKDKKVEGDCVGGKQKSTIKSGQNSMDLGNDEYIKNGETKGVFNGDTINSQCDKVERNNRNSTRHKGVKIRLLKNNPTKPSKTQTNPDKPSHNLNVNVNVNDDVDDNVDVDDNANVDDNVNVDEVVNVDVVGGVEEQGVCKKDGKIKINNNNQFGTLRSENNNNQFGTLHSENNNNQFGTLRSENNNNQFGTLHSENHLSKNLIDKDVKILQSLCKNLKIDCVVDTKKYDTSKLIQKVKESKYLKSFRSLAELLAKYADILRDKYKDFAVLSLSSQNKDATKHDYSQEELNALFTNIEDVEI